ncbi:MAG TPA: FAD binding domain-containing protein [Pseudolabrys sp.]|nr:FAD binding domain-containing protein [Pseudolabrys sp.]
MHHNFFRPKSLSEALDAVAPGNVAILAGGTDFFCYQTGLAAWSRVKPTAIVDLSKIEQLRGIALDQNEIRIGAMTTWSEVASLKLPPAFAALQQAALKVGGVQIQNRATIAGNLCNASPAADGVPPLLLFEADVELSSAGGVRRIALQSFLFGNRKTALSPGEIMTAIFLKRPSKDLRTTFRKLGARRYLVISLTMLAAGFEISQGKIIDARFSVGACSAVACRLSSLEGALRGLTVTPDILDVPAPTHLADLSPIDDVRATAVYRGQATLELLRRVIAELAGLKNGFSHAH